MFRPSQQAWDNCLHHPVTQEDSFHYQKVNTNTPQYDHFELFQIFSGRSLSIKNSKLGLRNQQGHGFREKKGKMKKLCSAYVKNIT